MSRSKQANGKPAVGDGVDTGITTGEQFQHFVFWAVKRHPKVEYNDEHVMKLLKREFPHRTDKRKWPNRKHRTFQSIDQQRRYTRTAPHPKHKLGIHTESQADEVLRRIDAKMRGKASSLVTSPRKSRQNRNGAGFGLPENNKLVERSAVSAVTKKYKNEGWLVKDVSAKCLGYDLECKKGNRREDVEVKGVTGNSFSFIITTNETREAKSNRKFILYVVTSALTKSPKLERFTGEEFLKTFDLSPVSFLARLRDSTRS